MKFNKNISVNELLSSDRYLFHADRIQRARDSLKRLAEVTAGIINDDDLSEEELDNLLKIIRGRTLHAIQLLNV